MTYKDAQDISLGSIYNHPYVKQVEFNTLLTGDCTLTMLLCDGASFDFTGLNDKDVLDKAYNCLTAIHIN